MAWADASLTWRWRQSTRHGDCPLSAGARSVLQALAMFMRDDKAWPSVPKIALAAGLATSTVYPYLAELECKGYLLRKKRKGQSTVYSPCIPSELDRAPWGDDDQGPGDDIRF